MTDVAATIANRPIEIDVLSNDVDFDGDALIIRTFSNPNIGTVAPQFNGRFLYTPQQNFTGQATFTYTISDDSLATDMGQVTITIFSGQFVVSDLSVAGSTTSAAYNISNVGEAVGALQTGSGNVVAFSSAQNFFDDTPAEALDANDFGQVVGAMATPLSSGGLTFQATRWDSTGTLVLGAFDGRSSKAYGINNEGQIVGASTRDNDAFLHAFLWEMGEMLPLESASDVESQAFAINERGQSAGYSGEQGVLWNGEAVQRLLSGAAGRAYDLNDRGQVVGSIDDGGVSAVYWEDDGAQQPIQIEGSDFSEAYGINNATWIVGAFRMAGAGKTQAAPAQRKAERLQRIIAGNRQISRPAMEQRQMRY